MCGIYGTWNQDGRPVDLAGLRSAVECLRHRGPDGEGYLLVCSREGGWVSCSGPDTPAELLLPEVGSIPHEGWDLALGHRRLSIIDLSVRAHQPMTALEGRFSLTFNGEIYNHAELRGVLEAEGFRFLTRADSEVVLAAYLHWGPECVRRFSGMWGFAIWDGRQQQLFCSRDRFGIKPFYYTHAGGRFSFASEVHALVGDGRLAFAPDPTAIYRFISCGLLPAARHGKTFFAGVAELPAGTSLIVRRNGVSTIRHYRLSVGHPSERVGDPGQVAAGLAGILQDSVSRHLVADVPVGSCLSGGLDSSSIVGLMCRLSGLGGDAQRGPRTVSAVYGEGDPINEAPFIAALGEALPIDARFTTPNIDTLCRDLEPLVWRQGEPFEGLSVFAQWCVMRLARESGLKVVLDGQGADEILGGYRPFVPYLSEVLRTGRFSQALRDLGDLHAVGGMSRAGLLAAALTQCLPNRLVAALRRAVLPRRARFDLLAADFRASMSPEQALGDMLEDHDDSLSHSLRSQIEDWSLPQLLRYEDRNSMAVGIEARVPFLDHRVVEYAFGPAADLRVHAGWTKWVLRRAMEGLLPDRIAWRRDKLGFAVPDAAWGSALCGRMGSILCTGSAASDYLDLPSARREAERPQGGVGAREVWRCINLDLWLRQWQRSCGVVGLSGCVAT